MKRRTKKLALTLLLSVALLSMNMNFVYAEEMGLSQTSDAGAPSDSIVTDAAAGTEQTEETVDETKADDSVMDENTESTEENNAAGAETENQETDGSDEAEESDTAGTENQETDGLENTEGDTTGEDDVAAADEAETETPETVYINKDGEEVVPSTLVGVDYTTIADSYDGEESVLKKYETSDVYEKDTVIDSYVDENGNLIVVISLGAAAAEAEEKEPGILDTIADVLGLDSEMGSSSDAPPVDGTFSGWDDIPISYEMNNDDSGNCWVNGYWITDPETGEAKQYILEEGTYDNVVRHEMQLYCDGDNVYLKITYASIYGGIWAFSPSENENAAHGNGEDFQFYIDGVDTKFQITQHGSDEPITKWTPEAGTYEVDVRNGNYDPSSTIVDGAVAYYHVTENGVNNQLELKIPMEAFQAQNGAVNLDNFNMVQFFTPNLMRDRITAAGSQTGAEPFAAAAFLLIPASYVWLKRKDDKEDMAFA